MEFSGVFAIPFPDKQAELELNPVLPTIDPELRNALNQLNLTRTGSITPCQEDPEEWDTQPTNVGHGANWRPESFTDYQARVIRVIDICMSECTAFTACLKVVNKLNMVNPAITGVIAGQLIDLSADGVKIRRSLDIQ